jgi:hypothetical protein
MIVLVLVVRQNDCTVLYTFDDDNHDIDDDDDDVGDDN